MVAFGVAHGNCRGGARRTTLRLPTKAARSGRSVGPYAGGPCVDVCRSPGNGRQWLDTVTGPAAVTHTSTATVALRR